MKAILIIGIFLSSFLSFGQETPQQKLELQLKGNNRSTEVSRVSNDNVVERRNMNREKRENHPANGNKERHHRPHFDKQKEHHRKENHRKENHPKEHERKEMNRDRLNDQRNDRMDKHKIK